jgi:hypothetical protein
MSLRPALHAALLIGGVALLGWFFAEVEIQIEGGNGWASALPVTFRVDHHWLLDLFWGGRPMTGYHAWVFPLIMLFFHFPMLSFACWSARLEARALGCTMIFWIIEDGLWFILNPAFGWHGLRPGAVGEAGCAWWHLHWFLGLPSDYWMFSLIGAGLLWWSFRPAPAPRPAGGDGAVAS